MIHKNVVLALAVLAASSTAAQAQLRRPLSGPRLEAISTAAPAPVVQRRAASEDNSRILREELAASQGAIRAALAAGQIGCERCIAAINGKPVQRVTFTPGTEELAAAYTIIGAGFGDKPGSVYLAGRFNTRPELRVDSWNDRQIVAYFPRGLRGEVDQGEVSLVVKMNDGSLVQTPATGRFRAAREEQVIGFDAIPRSAIRYQSDTALEMEARDGGLYFYGVDSGDSVKRGYEDRIVLNFLKPGFEGVAASVGFCRSDTGDASASGERGGRYVYGNYAMRWDRDDLIISRAMWQDHRSPNMMLPGLNVFKSCFRDLKITVSGPAGIAPLK